MPDILSLVAGPLNLLFQYLFGAPSATNLGNQHEELLRQLENERQRNERAKQEYNHEMMMMREENMQNSKQMAQLVTLEFI